MSGVMQMVLGQYYSTVAPPGSQSYTTPGTYVWVAPAGVTSVSIVAIGGGSRSNYGGGLGWKNNYTVTPGTAYSVTVGAGGSGNTTGCCSYFFRVCIVRGKGGKTGQCGGYVGDGGGNGGQIGGGGAGAGGYTGNGGQGAAYASYGSCGSSGSGGGGGGGSFIGFCCCGGATGWGSGGGGTGLFGQGASGAGGIRIGSPLTGIAYGGGGGSGGCSGTNANRNGTLTGSGGLYGGAAGVNGCFGSSGVGANGAVRIVWPGTTRQFPSTCVGSP